jgi:hypothetical protein
MSSVWQKDEKEDRIRAMIKETLKFLKGSQRLINEKGFDYDGE